MKTRPNIGIVSDLLFLKSSMHQYLLNGLNCKGFFRNQMKGTSNPSITGAQRMSLRAKRSNLAALGIASSFHFSQ
jgi:hypothetical protein